MCSGQVEAEEFPELSLKYEIAAVPTFVFMKVWKSAEWIITSHHQPKPLPIPPPLPPPPPLQAGKVVDRVNGAHVPELTKKTSVHSEMLAPPPLPAAEVCVYVCHSTFSCSTHQNYAVVCCCTEMGVAL